MPISLMELREAARRAVSPTLYGDLMRKAMDGSLDHYLYALARATSVEPRSSMSSNFSVITMQCFHPAIASSFVECSHACATTPRLAEAMLAGGYMREVKLGHLHWLDFDRIADTWSRSLSWTVGFYVDELLAPTIDGGVREGHAETRNLGTVTIQEMIYAVRGRNLQQALEALEALMWRAKPGPAPLAYSDQKLTIAWLTPYLHPKNTRDLRQVVDSLAFKPHLKRHNMLRSKQVSLNSVQSVKTVVEYIRACGQGHFVLLAR